MSPGLPLFIQHTLAWCPLSHRPCPDSGRDARSCPAPSPEEAGLPPVLMLNPKPNPKVPEPGFADPHWLGQIHRAGFLPHLHSSEPAGLEGSRGPGQQVSGLELRPWQWMGFKPLCSWRPCRALHLLPSGGRISRSKPIRGN